MEFYGENAEDMMANEVDLLHNFGPCPRDEVIQFCRERRLHSAIQSDTPEC